jgi:hypothetical protein
MTSTDEDLQKVSKDMEALEDSLAATGFPEEQWMLIKQYMILACKQSHLAVVKALEEQKT